MVDTSLLSFIMRSQKRERILLAMKKQNTPTRLAKELGMHRSHISRTLAEFEGRGLVKCITPKERIGRLYKLTEKGRNVAKRMSGETE